MRRDFAAALFVSLLVLVLSSACSRIDPSISEQDAIIIAKNVLSSQTQFTAKVNGESKTVTNISVSSANAVYANSQWNVALHVTGTDQDGLPRQNDVVVVLSRKGEVLGVGSGKVG